MYLLDTSALVKLAAEFANGRTGPMRRFLGGRMPVFISVVCYEEFLEGFEDVLEAREFIKDGGFRMLTIGRSVAVRCAAMQRQLSDHGLRLGENDSWIAATALSANLELVGDDTAFSRVPGLRYRRI